MKYAHILAILAAATMVAGFASTAEARAGRVVEVPFGGTFSCGLCHTDALGSGPRNEFGTQVETMGLDGDGSLETQAVVWADIYDLDADGDGFTNGQELGDPDGTWMSGDGDPDTENIAHPSLAEDVPEGDPTGDGSGDDAADEGCAVAPGEVGASGLLLALLGLVWALRRR